MKWTHDIMLVVMQMPNGTGSKYSLEMAHEPFQTAWFHHLNLSNCTYKVEIAQSECPLQLPSV